MPTLLFYASMKTTLIFVQVAISILLSLMILLQNKDGGLSATFGGGEGFASTKRGAEKVIYLSTIVLAAAFLANALLLATL